MHIFRLGIWALALSTTSLAHPSSPAITKSRSREEAIGEYDGEPKWWNWGLATLITGLTALTIVDSVASEMEFCLTVTHENVEPWTERVKQCCVIVKLPGKLCRPLLARAISKARATIDREAAGRTEVEEFLEREYTGGREQSPPSEENGDQNSNPSSFSLKPLRDSLIQGVNKFGHAIGSVKKAPMSMPFPGGAFRLPAVGALRKRDTKEFNIGAIPTSPDADAMNQQVTLGYGFPVTALTIDAYAKYLQAGVELKSCITSSGQMQTPSDDQVRKCCETHTGLSEDMCRAMWRHAMTKGKEQAAEWEAEAKQLDRWRPPSERGTRRGSLGV